MTNVDDDREPERESADPAGSTDPAHPAPLGDPRSARAQPYEALFPGLDRVSPSTFRKGSLSRRRVNIAAMVLVAVGVITVGLIAFGGVLFGPR